MASRDAGHGFPRSKSTFDIGLTSVNDVKLDARAKLRAQTRQIIDFY